jgi:hypothetical protein
MNKEFKDRMKGIFIVPLSLIIILVPFSLVVGWNLLSLFIFWFVLTPLAAYFLPVMVSKTRSHLTGSVAGLLIFYGFMVFMIYDHYRTDYFQIMIASCVVNIGLVTILSLSRDGKVKAR